MNAQTLGLTVFNSLPSWVKGTITFTRTSIASYDPITGITTTNVITATCPCVVQAAQGTRSEGFVDGESIRDKHLQITVPAAALQGFVPEAGDVAQLAGSGEVFTLTGVETTAPDGTTAGIYTIAMER